MKLTDEEQIERIEKLEQQVIMIAKWLATSHPKSITELIANLQLDRGTMSEIVKRAQTRWGSL